MPSKKVEYNMKYNQGHYVRIPLDVTIPEYNALREYTQATGQPVNGLLREQIRDLVPKDIMERHANDTERAK